MTSQAKAVLNGIKKLTNNTSKEFGYIGYSNEFCLEDDTSISYSYEQYADEISSIMDLLIREGYVVQGYNQYHFSLTQKGIHPDQFAVSAFATYLRDNWIAIIALVISVIALIRSL